jgi:hypothetical protein
MKQIIGIAILFLALGVVGSFSSGWFQVAYTSTVENARQDAEKNAFKKFQSYIEGKEQEVSKLKYKYLTTKDPQERAAIRASLRSSLENFDLAKIDQDLNMLSQDLQAFVDSTAH